ncbi:hypothetical protein [Arthrobacter sp. SLBN-53]|nr:hypothetical protein [Arthrobacter sp. SLBN-53]
MKADPVERSVADFGSFDDDEVEVEDPEEEDELADVPAEPEDESSAMATP